MKKVILPILFFVLAWSFKAYSQEVLINSFDNYRADTSFSWTSNVEGGNSYFRVSQDSTDYKEGAASMVISTEIDSLHPWGSYSQLIWSAPTGTTLDWSSSDTLRLWIKIVKAPVYPQYMSFRIQLRDNGPTGTDPTETYIYQNDLCLDNAGDWFLLKVPLHEINSQTRTVTPGDSGFVEAPGNWGGFTYNDDKLNLDKITGWNIVCVTTTTSANPNPPAGLTNVPADSLVMKIDGFERTGNKPVPFVIFNGIAISGNCAPGGFTWGNSSFQVVEGAGPVANSNAIQWNLGDQWGNGWTGFGWNISPAVNLSGGWPVDSLKFMMKTNAVADSFRVQFENGAGKVGFVFNSAADTNWHQYSLPLNKFVAQDANVFDPSAVGVFQIMTQHDSALGIAGKVAYITNLWTGNPKIDVIPPVAPTGVSVVNNNDFTNTIIWTDVPGQSAGTYNIYYSLNPITDITAAGVEVATTGVIAGTEYYKHRLLAPATDQQVTYYYAVVCKSGAGILGLPGSTSSVTNTAKGVAVINPTAPANFAADGDLSEWSGITPFKLYISDHSGTPVANSKITSDTVSSGDIYVAVDKDYLYVAAHINTNNIYTSNSTSYQNTSFDLFLGLYNWHGASHTSLLTGAAPDYHFRFCQDRVLVDNNGTDSLEIPGDNYYWSSRFPDPLSGYNVEAKIAWTDIAHKRAGSTMTGTDNVFSPVKGMRIPFDIELNSVSTGATQRDGQLDYSPIAAGNSWSNVALWSYTWIGDQWTTPVKDTKQTVYSYKLSQNYPNPFNPNTNIQYTIVKAGHVTLTVYDILGRKVATLINSDQAAGNHSVNFNASRFASGVYFYRIEAGDFTSVKKMMLLK